MKRFKDSKEDENEKQSCFQDSEALDALLGDESDDSDFEVIYFEFNAKNKLSIWTNYQFDWQSLSLLFLVIGWFFQ